MNIRFLLIVPPLLFLLCSPNVGILPSLGQSQTRTQTWYTPFPVRAIRIQLTIEPIPSMPDTYLLSWEDSLGQIEQFSPANRPEELWVVVRDKKGICGYYQGNNPSQVSCQFVSREKEIQVFFSRHRNPYFRQSTIPPTPSDENQATDQLTSISLSLIKISSLFEERPWDEYQAVQLKLEPVQQLPCFLPTDPDIVRLYYLNKGALNPDPMPRFGPSYCGLLSRRRFFVNGKTGRIKRGNAWLDWSGAKKCCAKDLRVVDPQANYQNWDGKIFRGKQLIRKRKISPQRFDMNQFSYLGPAMPY